MKKLLQALFILAFAFVSISEAQVTKTLIGSSYNIYSVISGSTNPLHANNDLGTISFTHRQNSNLVGGSGVIQTSWSTDGGETWEYVLQPTNDSTQFNRYPSGAIVDPIGNGLSSAHTVVAGPTTSSAASGWLANYFYNFALDGSGGREYNRLEPNNTADQAKLTRVGMMVDKNNIVRILGYFNTNLYITTGEFNPTGTNYYTDFVYASTASYYTGEYVDENGNVTTPAAWGPANGIELGDTIFYMTSENYDLFSDGTIDPTWTNEIEIINYEIEYDSTWTGSWNLETLTNITYDTLYNSVISNIDSTLTISLDSTYIDSTLTWLYDTLFTTSYDTSYVDEINQIDTLESTFIDSSIVIQWNVDTLTNITYDTTYSTSVNIDTLLVSSIDSMLSISYDSTYIDSTLTWLYDTLFTTSYDTTEVLTYDTSYVDLTQIDSLESTSIDSIILDQWNVIGNIITVDTL